jgi:hypothetical protein
VLAESFERIHRSNPGVLPLQFVPGQNVRLLSLTGEGPPPTAGWPRADPLGRRPRSEDGEWPVRWSPSPLLALLAGRELAEDEAPDAATPGCLASRSWLATASEWVPNEHDLLPIPGQRNQPIADTDEVVLLTVRLG